MNFHIALGALILLLALSLAALVSRRLVQHHASQRQPRRVGQHRAPSRWSR